MGTAAPHHVSAHVYCGQTAAHLSYCCALVLVTRGAIYQTASYERRLVSKNTALNDFVLSISDLTIIIIIVYYAKRRHLYTNK